MDYSRYQNRIIQMQDEITKIMLQKISTANPLDSEACQRAISREFNTYVETIHRTSERECVTDFREKLEKFQDISSIPSVFFNTEDGRQITQKALTNFTENFPFNFEEEFDKIKKVKIEKVEDVVRSVHKKLVQISYNLNHIKNVAEISTVISPEKAQEFYSNYIQAFEKIHVFISNTPNISATYSEFALDNSQAAIKTLEKSLPIATQFAKNVKTVLNNREQFGAKIAMELNSTTENERKFSI